MWAQRGRRAGSKGRTEGKKLAESLRWLVLASEESPLTQSKEALHTQRHTDRSRALPPSKRCLWSKTNEVGQAKVKDPPFQPDGLLSWILNQKSLCSCPQHGWWKLKYQKNWGLFLRARCHLSVGPQRRWNKIPCDVIPWTYGNEAAFPGWPSTEKSVPFLNMVTVSLKGHFFDAP